MAWPPRLFSDFVTVPACGAFFANIQNGAEAMA
jgi:hypothetical protein